MTGKTPGPRVACVLMQRNEAAALEPWLRYHGDLFGLENLFVIDHASNNPSVVATLASYEAAGVQVIRLSAAADYRRKGDYVTQVLQTADETGLYDILLPLDCDEFLAMRRPDGLPTCDKAALLDHLAEYRGQQAVMHVRENFLNIIGHPGFFWPFPYQKVFFAGGCCGVLDHGSHADIAGVSDQVRVTRLLYLHFHHRPLRQLQIMSREKLQPFVNVDDRAALRAFRGVGWHLVLNMLRTEAEYTAFMQPNHASIEFPEIVTRFNALGIDPAFCEH